MLAIVKATERFHIYLAGVEFKVVTDCIVLVGAVNKANINPRVARRILRLQNYTFKMEHRGGHKMKHVDALSRVVSAVEAMPIGLELQYRQLADPRIRELVQQLEEKEHKKFSLINGLVYRKDLERPKFVIPDAMVHNMLRIYHDAAHCGAKKLFTV